MDVSSISSAMSALGSVGLPAQLNKETAASDSFEAALNKALEDKNDAELRNACAEFEAYFINLMFKEMRKTGFAQEGILPKSFAEETFQEMLDEENSKTAANSGGIGLADMMYRQMSQNLQ